MASELLMHVSDRPEGAEGGVGLERRNGLRRRTGASAVLGQSVQADVCMCHQGLGMGV